MNLKALITTLVLGSSSIGASSLASADSISFSGSVSVSLGGSAAPAYRPAPSAPAYRPAPSTPVAADDCHDEPVYQPVPVTPVYHPTPAPVWQAPVYRITNTTMSKNGSHYTGKVGYSRILEVPVEPPKRYVGAHAFAIVKPKPTQAWFDLTEATRIDGGREFFKVGADHGLFNTLQLQALGNGSSRIQQVYVEFADGKSTAQMFRLNNTMINRTNGTISLDLNGEYRSIKRIIVYGATDQGSAFKLLAK